MKKIGINQLRELIREQLKQIHEMSNTGGGASFNAGTGAQYATPKAFSNKKKEIPRTSKKIGYKAVKNKKRPYNTLCSYK